MTSIDQLPELLRRAGGGEQRAFAELYRLTSGKLFGVALRILQRSDWAEDVLQECYVNIWHNAAQYGADKSQPLTWMTSIVRNRCIDWLRRPHEERLPEDADGKQVVDIEDEAAGPLQQLLDFSDSAALAGCLRQLDGRQRQSIALAYVHGLSHSELAEHLTTPIGTVKTWIRKGLEHLKGCLNA